MDRTSFLSVLSLAPEPNSTAAEVLLGIFASLSFVELCRRNRNRVWDAVLPSPSPSAWSHCCPNTRLYMQTCPSRAVFTENPTTDMEKNESSVRQTLEIAFSLINSYPPPLLHLLVDTRPHVLPMVGAALLNPDRSFELVTISHNDSEWSGKRHASCAWDGGRCARLRMRGYHSSMYRRSRFLRNATNAKHYEQEKEKICCQE